MNKLYIFLLFLFASFAFSQSKIKDTITRKAIIDYEKKGNQVLFKSQTPLLNQIAGAPPASYSYFWEFGDGSYSKEKEPKKVYKKKGDYKVNLSVTNNYDNGKPPSTRPKIVAVNEIINTNYSETAQLADSTSMVLFANRDPVVDEEIIVALSYQNNLDYSTNGKLYLFYNDKEFKNKNFELLETRIHFGEREIQENNVACVDEKNNGHENTASANDYLATKKTFFSDDENLETTLLESKSNFSDSKILEFDGMNPKETRTVFFTFKTTPEMLKDTSATVRIRGVYVPDRNYKNHKKKTLEMEIVTSHDPNKMSSNATLINYRLVRLKTTNFKTRFQNDGEGPARTIRLETDIPEIFDKKTLQIVDCYPKCPICPKGENVTYSCIDTIIKKNQIHFTFKNIYLPGSNQKNVTERDSTKGFVKYSLKFGKDFHKIKTKSKTSIFFDKNEPVITNYATTRFKMGISIGVKAGYNLYPNLNNSQSYFVAATICPYKSYHWYWQVELQNSFQKYDNGEALVSDRTADFSTPPNGTFQLERTYTNYNFENINLAIPILARYNVNNFIGIGAGIQGNVNISQKETITNDVVRYESTAPVFVTSTSQNSTNESKSFQNFNGGLLFDVTIGFARIGPSLGARYVMNSQKNFNYWQFYAIWKF